jgi:hypothetical protein
LADDDYRVVVTFLWSANRKETEQTAVKPTTSPGEEGCTAVMAAGGVFLLLLGLLLASKIIRRCSKPRNSH